MRRLGLLLLLVPFGLPAASELSFQGKVAYSWVLSGRQRRFRLPDSPWGGSCRFLEALSVRLSVDFQHWETGSGADRTILDDGTGIKSRLNATAWCSLGGVLSLSIDRGDRATLLAVLRGALADADLVRRFDLTGDGRVPAWTMLGLRVSTLFRRRPFPGS